jgi:hypothetical protein
MEDPTLLLAKLPSRLHLRRFGRLLVWGVIWHVGDVSKTDDPRPRYAQKISPARCGAKVREEEQKLRQKSEKILHEFARPMVAKIPHLCPKIAHY